MAEITSQMVKELREKTNAGMMDCKKALTETGGDMEKAVDLLRQKGLAVAAKRSGKEANEGVIESYIHSGGKLGVLVGDGANALPSTLSIGIILGTVIFGPVVDKFGYKGLLIAASVLALAGLQGLARFLQLPLLHGAMFFLGLGGGILNGLTNAVVSDIYDDDKRGGRLGVLGAFYCIGALLWTLLNYFIPNYNIPLNAISVVMALFIVFFCFTAFPKAKPSENVSLNKSLSLLKYPALLLFSVVLFFESGFEGCSGSFTVEFFDRTTPMGTKAATLAMTWFTVGMMAGRFPLGAIMRRLKALGTLYTYLSVAILRHFQLERLL